MFPTISGGMVTNWTSYSWYCAVSRSCMSLHEVKKNADTRDRTGDLQIFSLTLSQLSYSGIYRKYKFSNLWSESINVECPKMVMKGLEPSTGSLLDCRSTNWATRPRRLLKAVYRQMLFDVRMFSHKIVSPSMGIEPTTTRLRVLRSTIWATKAARLYSILTW